MYCFCVFIDKVSVDAAVLWSISNKPVSLAKIEEAEFNF